MRDERKRRWDREHKLRSPNPSGGAGKLSDRQKERMRERRAAGVRVEDIAEEFGVHYDTVSRLTKP